MAKNLIRLILLTLTIVSFVKTMDESALIKEMEAFNNWAEANKDAKEFKVKKYKPRV